ncbi:glycosyltransferase family protein [Thermoflexibacter ruber]|nr:hypothetical protein [Thermoflexibacter ruber]
MKIIIIHPEGNFNNNPNLLAITQILIENNYQVDILLPKKNIYQKSIHPMNRLFFYEEHDSSILSENYKLVIGVDLGIIDAALIATIKQVPLGYISYEIFFEDEVGYYPKQLEIIACRAVDFVICQDIIRAEHLSKQNEIPLDKFILIPVAGLDIVRKDKNKFLHDKLSIPHNRKIALLMGSVAKFTMAEEIIENTQYWDKSWCLVVHDRYGKTPLKEKYTYLPNVYFSEEPTDSFESLSTLIASVDVGIALYQQQTGDIYQGKNIKYIGLSSGKIATMLQNGKPVIVNQIGKYAELILKYNAGRVISSINELPQNLSEIDNVPGSIAENCYNLFTEHLSARLYAKVLTNTISEIINRNHSVKSLDILKNQINTFFHIIHLRKKQIEAERLKENVYKSYSYRIGHLITQPYRFIYKILEYLK